MSYDACADVGVDDGVDDITSWSLNCNWLNYFGLIRSYFVLLRLTWCALVSLGLPLFHVGLTWLNLD